MSTNSTNAAAANQYRTRVLGSSYTVWSVGTASGAKTPIVWCVEVAHKSPSPVAQAMPIHPLNYIRPAEIVTPRAITYGEITLNVVETYGNKAWDYLATLFPASNWGSIGKTNGPNDLADIFNYMAEYLSGSGQIGDSNSQIALQRLIRTPGTNGLWYVTDYHGVKIVDIREDEDATTGAMQNNLTISCWYTHKTDNAIKLANPAATGGGNINDGANGYI